MKVLLTSIERFPRCALPLERLLIVEGLPFENQIAIINAMHYRNLLNLKPLINLEITTLGKKTLIELNC
jgi:hypothetical protein